MRTRPTMLSNISVHQWLKMIVWIMDELLSRRGASTSPTSAYGGLLVFEFLNFTLEVAGGDTAFAFLEAIEVSLVEDLAAFGASVGSYFYDVVGFG